MCVRLRLESSVGAGYPGSEYTLEFSMQGSPWYQVYVDYCVSNGIIKDLLI